MNLQIRHISQAYLLLHFCIFLWGFTAILGKWISLTGLILVWWRLLLTCASLLPILKPRRWKKDISTGLFRELVGIGMLVSLHWVGFYMSIKWANASVALAALATTSFFTSLIEPIIVQRSFKWYEMLLGILVIPGILLIASDLNWQMQWGFAIGLFSAFLLSIFSSLNKRIVARVEVVTATFIELGSGLIFLSLLLPFYLTLSSDTPVFWPTTQTLGWLLILSLCCTTVPYMLSLVALRHLSAFSSALALNMEPVYGILMAVILLGENKELSSSFYLGGLIIMSAVFSHPLVKYYFDKKNISTDHAESLHPRT